MCQVGPGDPIYSEQKTFNKQKSTHLKSLQAGV